MTTRFENLMVRVHARAEQRPDATAFIYLRDGESDEVEFTYSALDQQARAIATWLQAEGMRGKRVLLLYTPGIEFILALCGCFYAGAIAVPAYPPDPTRLNRTLPRLRAIVEDCDPALVLTTSAILEMAQFLLATAPDLAAKRWAASEDLPLASATAWVDPEVRGDDLAFLQYTSGSTGTPKGVMVSHENLMHNERMIEASFRHSSSTVYVSWLPFFHDMGLIGNLLHPLYLGVACTFMSPMAFLQKPVRWLQAISRYRATTSGGPNFAFDLCVNRIAPEQCEGLDLSSWDLAFNGAETVRRDTMDRFAARFAPYGFRREAFYPCYGLAEATLLVASGVKTDAPKTLSLENAELQRDRVAIVAEEDATSSSSFVSCGHPSGDLEVVIVDPETQVRCPPGRVGEIWTSGLSVVRGYWNCPEETEATFRARIAGGGELNFLRTGDLGFLHEGELYITGRRKDLIIIRGRNHYPQDIELTVEQCHARLRPSCTAAFSIEQADGEALAVVAEVDTRELEEDPSRKQQALDEIIATIRHAVSQQHELQVGAVALIKPRSIPKTSSGKIQRRQCRVEYIAGSLQLVTQDVLAAEPSAAFVLPSGSPLAGLVAILERRLGLPAGSVDPGQPVASYGLDSLSAIEIQAQAETLLGVRLPLEILLSGESLNGLLLLSESPTADAIERPAQAGHRLPKPPTLELSPEDRFQSFPLSDLQQAYWVGRHETFDLGNVRGHAYLEIEAQHLDEGRLAAAWQRLVERHDMLRAVILSDGRQQVLERADWGVVAVLDLSACSAEKADSGIATVRSEMSSELPLTDDLPPVELRLTHLPHQRSHLHLRVDLTVADFQSTMILMRELQQLYNDPGASLPELEVTFRDYRLAERAHEGSASYHRARDYWLERLDAIPPAPDLPLVRNPSSVDRPRFERRTRVVDSATWQRLKQRAVQMRLTPSALCLAAFVEILRTWSARADFTVTLTTFNRQPLHRQINDVVGDFTSTILFAAEEEAGADLTAKAMRIQRQLWRDLDHSQFSGVRVLRERTRREGGALGAAMPVVFTSTLGLEQGESGVDGFGQLVHSANPTPHVYLNSHVMELSGALFIHWDTLAGLFAPGLPDDMVEAFGALLESMADSDSAWTATERRWIPPNQLAQRATVNATEGPISGELLHTGFVAQARLRPDHPALIAPDRTLTYGELYALANELGHSLRRLGATPNTLVGVVLEKGWKQVVAVLAILMSGAAYLPIDIASPPLRRKHLLEQGGVRIVVAPQEMAFPEGIQAIHLDGSALPSHLPPLEDAQESEDLAYVIYTSGSTGQPKGVMINHRGALNTIRDINDRFGVGPEDRVLMVSSLGFDLSVYDVFGALAAGGTVVIPEGTSAADPAHWGELLAEHRVTVWNSVPALMQLLVEEAELSSTMGASQLRLVMLSGDWIPVGLPDRIRRAFAGAQVTSLGGATEASIWSVIHPIGAVDPAWPSIPYGRPLMNQSCHVLDERFEPCPTWVPGNLYIGGIGLSLGYWKNRTETEARFIVHPRTGQRLYHTGDLARYLPDGNLEFLGRADFQVKINGFRIELGEIEAVLARCPSVLQAVAAVDTTFRGERRIVAYVVPRAEDAFAAEAVLSDLREQLPGYMVPALLIPLNSLPLSANGKVDRAALPAPQSALPQSATVPRAGPPAELEAKLSAIVAGVLEIQDVDVRSNLFELGATSMHMIRIRTQLKAALGIDLKIVDLFTHTTIAALAAHLGPSQSGSSSELRLRAEKQKAFFRRQSQHTKAAS